MKNIQKFLEIEEKSTKEVLGQGFVVKRTLGQLLAHIRLMKPIK